ALRAGWPAKAGTPNINLMKQIAIIIAVLLFTLSSFGQRELGIRPTATGGPLRFEQAVFDVQSYDVTVNADPATKTISGTTIMTARIVIPTNVIQLDLDTPYTISKLTDGQADLKYRFEDGKIWISF